MAYRITKYEQAFEDVLNMRFDDKLQGLVRVLEHEGHTEKSICFSIWKSQRKLIAFKGDSRFIGILRNEVNKWSWKKDDPRWQEYWDRKKEEERAKKIRAEIDSHRQHQAELTEMDKRTKAKKQPKGYVYFIQGKCGGAIKVGYSVNPEGRLRELQTGYPDTLMILLMIPGTQSTERALHKEFEAAKLKGEWFRPDAAVIERIKELNGKYHGGQYNVG